MRGLALLVLLLTTGCYAEMTGGLYRAAGDLEGTAYNMGLNFGIQYDYHKWLRLGAGGDAIMNIAKSARGEDVRVRGLGVNARADWTVVGDPKKRLRLSGAAHFDNRGDTVLEPGEDQRVEGNTRMHGYWLGLSGEVTDPPTGVTAAIAVGPHVMYVKSDVLEDSTLTGAQLRLSYTWFPVFRTLSGPCGFWITAMQNYTPSAPIEGYCGSYESCTKDGFGTTTCRTYTHCN